MRAHLFSQAVEKRLLSSFVDVVAFAINAALAVLAHHVGGVLPTPAVYELEPKLG